MKIVLLCVGKTDAGFLSEGTEVYTRRLKHYLPFEIYCIAEQKTWKKMTPDLRKKAEGTAISEFISAGDQVVLLDEGGREFNSENFAHYLEKQMVAGHKRLVFVVGGAFGFSPEIYEVATSKMALSQMTFSHQMVRMFFAEQLYRAMTILRNEPYHNS